MTKTSNNIIRTSRHYYSDDTNTNKEQSIIAIVTQYKEATQMFIDYLWNNEVIWKTKKATKVLNIKQDLLECPSFISTKEFSYKNLSQRMLKCAATQACSIVKSQVELRRKRQYVFAKTQSEHLKKKLEEIPLVKPELGDYFKCEINSVSADIELNGQDYCFLQLKSLGKDFNSFRLPFKFHKQAKKWQEKGKVLNSFLITPTYVEIRWSMPKPPLKTTGKKVGGDQGQITCLTLSDGQVTTKNKDGYDLNNIGDILERREKGSNGFKRAQEHRKNHTNWSINQLNLTNVSELGLENVRYLRYEKNFGRKQSHWRYTLIKDKCTRVCEETGVRLTLQNSPYRSQRCSQCGLVLKSNRTGKVYSCCKCGYTDDADYNASCNHAITLPPLSLDFIRLKKNRTGFYWLESGLFDLDGKEFTVPCTS